VLVLALVTALGAVSPSASATSKPTREEGSARPFAGSDSVPPIVSITAPVAGATVSGTITLSGTASDDVRLVKVKYRVDRRGDFVAADGTTSWAGSIDTTSVPDGAHVIWVRAVDSSANVTATSVDVIVDNAVIAPTPSPSPSPSPYPSPTPSAGHTTWGIFSSPRGSMSGEQVNQYIESLVGREFGGQRIYSSMSYDVPGSGDRLVASEGGVIYHNINSWYLGASGQKVCRSWADTAAGVYDAWWITQAQNIATFGYPMLLSFTHEPTVDALVHPKCGTAAEYRAAYDHIVQLFASQGVTNVEWVWTLTASTFNGQQGGPTAWEPSHYDIVGVDGYSRVSKPRSPQEIFQAAEDFSKLRGKPLLVGEIGCEELSGNPDAKARWVTQAATMFEAWDNVVAIMWNNDSPYFVDSSPEAFAAFTAAGLDPYYGGRTRPLVR